MFAEERRSAIASLVRDHGRVTAKDLSSRYEVTLETVRRDLQGLQDRGLIQRVYGGAVAVNELVHEVAVASRDVLMGEEKERIGQAAIDFLPKDGAIFIDAGSTTARFAAAISGSQRLTIFTNALPIAMDLSHRTTHAVHTVGGRVRGTTYAEVDGWALERLVSLRVDVAFVGANGIDPEWGLSTPDPSEAAVKRAILASGTQCVLLADHTKVGASFACRYGDLDSIDVLITDHDIAEDAHRTLRDRGLEVVVV